MPQRKPLQELGNNKQNKRRGPELSNETRGYICGLMDAGLSGREVSRKTGIPEPTVRYTKKMQESRQ